MVRNTIRRKQAIEQKRRQMARRRVRKLFEHVPEAERPAMLEQFYKRTVEAANGCLLWTGPRSMYGIFTFRGYRVSAHRFPHVVVAGWKDFSGHVLHGCGNVLCVRHTRVGSHAQNMQDALMAGTYRSLSNAKVDQIFEFRKLGLSQKEIAAKMSCDQTTVSRILRGEFKRNFRLAV